MLHWTVLGVVALLGTLFVVSQVLFWLLRRLDAGFTAVKLVAVTLELVAIVGAYNVTVLGEPGQLAASAAGSPLAAVAVNALVATMVAAVGAFLLARGAIPLLQGLRPGTYTIPERFRRHLQRTMVAVLVALLLVLETIRLGVVGVSDAWVVVAILGALTVYITRTSYLAVSPLDGNLLRDPTDEERERIEACYERFGRSPGRIVIAAEDAKIAANAVGRGAYHSVGVTEQFLARVDDTTLAVTLAQADERSARGYWTSFISIGTSTFLLLSLVFIVWPAFLLGLFTTSLPLVWFVMPLLVFIPVPLLIWRARQSVFKADTFVASQFDTSTVATVYRELGDDLCYHRTLGGLFNRYLSLDPTIERRLEALGIEPSADTTGQAGGDASVADETATGPTREEQAQPDPGTGWRRWVLATTVLATLSGLGFVTTTIIAESGAIGSVSGILAVLALVTTMATSLTTAVSWLFLPFFIYLDSKTAQLVTGWPSHRLLYLVGALVPLLNVLVGAVYLWRRPRFPSSGETARPADR